MEFNRHILQRFTPFPPTLSAACGDGGVVVGDFAGAVSAKMALAGRKNYVDLLSTNCREFKGFIRVSRRSQTRDIVAERMGATARTDNSACFEATIDDVV